MSSLTEIKEQMRVLREQEKAKKKELLELSKVFTYWETQKNNHPEFCHLVNHSTATTFEDFIVKSGLKPNSKINFEFIYQYRKFTDEDFFIAFNSWKITSKVTELDMADRKCCCCFNYYANDKTLIDGGVKWIKNMAKCSHHLCNGCHKKLKKVGGYRECPICRTTEAP